MRAHNSRHAVSAPHLAGFRRFNEFIWEISTDKFGQFNRQSPRMILAHDHIERQCDDLDKKKASQ